MPIELVKFWRRCELTAPPYAHPDDLPVLQRGNGKHIDYEPKNFTTFITGLRSVDFNDHRLHLSLFPFPYCGNLASAKIVILLLNPGVSYTDYYAETHVRACRRRLELNLRQSFDGIEFPFLWLDPEFCWHGGFTWWEKKLRKVIRKIAEKKFENRYRDALCHLSKRLACVELVPYHSPSFRGHALIDELPSVKAAKQFVSDVLVRAAKRGEKTIIVTRQNTAWGLPARMTKNLKNLVIYEGGQTRGASLGPRTAGGQAILRHCGVRSPMA